MEHTFTKHGNIQVLEVEHLLYQYDNKQVLTKVEEYIADGYNEFIIDLSALKIINSIGLSFLIAALTKARSAGGEVLIVNLLPEVEKLLAITKLKSIFTVFTTVEEALAYLVPVPTKD